MRIRIIPIALILLTVVLVRPIWAYDPRSHQEMSARALLLSSLGTDSDLLNRMGLKSLSNTTQTFPNALSRPNSIPDLIKFGASFEDNLERPLNHFYDPVNNKTIDISTYNNELSPDWALEDKEDYGTQPYSLKNARKWLYLGLTDLLEVDRNKNLGLAFQSIGHVIHHMQDMAQPQHVRLDEHCDNLLLCAPVNRYSPSWYEKYTLTAQDLKYTGYSKPRFRKAREFWHTSEEEILRRRGIADYTNRNFVSIGTIRVRRYQLPLLLDNNYKVDARTEFAAVSGEVTLPPDCENDANPCYLGYLENYVIDADGSSKLNRKSATHSVFDQYLKIHDVAVEYTSSDGQKYWANQITSLNRFNFDSAHDFLIPRAVAYSAGMIDHFFRGRIKVVNPAFANGKVTLKLRNDIDKHNVDEWMDDAIQTAGRNGPSQLIVTFEYEKENGEKVFGKTNSVTLNESINPGKISASTYSLSFAPGALDNVDIPNAQFRLVYRGGLGQEDDAVIAAPFKVISGFIVTPNYVPEDELSQAGEPRLIYKQGGQWRLSKKRDLKFGNIDWKGWYVGGKATQVLTWSGPPARHMPIRWVDEYAGWIFQKEIYKDGVILAEAPLPVMGAALTRDGLNNTWLIAIGRGGSEDVVYRKKVQDSVAVGAWDVIARFPYGGSGVSVFAPATPWFFNGDGTEAQAMRTVNSNYKPWRVKIRLNTAGQNFTATKEKMSVGPGFNRGPVTCGVNYDEQGAGGGNWNATTSGEWVWAVDYINNKEILAHIVLKADFEGNVDVTQEKNSNGSIKSETGNGYFIINESEFLRIGSKSIPYLETHKQVNWSWNTGDPYRTYGEDFYFGKTWAYHFDLRNEIYSYGEERYSRNFSGDGQTEDYNYDWLVEGNIESAVAAKKHVFTATSGSGASTRPAWYKMRQSGCWIGRNVVDEYWTNIGGQSAEIGSWLVDIEGNAMFSQGYYTDYDGSSDAEIDYITGGMLTSIIKPLVPISGKAKFYPAGLVK